MNRQDRLALLRPGVAGRVWADLGAGTGAFTEVLAELLGPSGVVYAVERKVQALSQLRTWPGGARVVPVHGDFTRPLGLSPLDGALLANSLHFVRNQVGALADLRAQLAPAGRLLVVEYEHRTASPWVPHPLPFVALAVVAGQAGLSAPRRLTTRPSRYGGDIYAAVITPGRSP